MHCPSKPSRLVSARCLEELNGRRVSNRGADEYRSVAVQSAKRGAVGGGMRSREVMRWMVMVIRMGSVATAAVAARVRATRLAGMLRRRDQGGGGGGECGLGGARRQRCLPTVAVAAGRRYHNKLITVWLEVLLHGALLAAAAFLIIGGHQHHRALITRCSEDMIGGDSVRVARVHLETSIVERRSLRRTSSRGRPLHVENVEVRRRALEGRVIIEERTYTAALGRDHVDAILVAKIAAAAVAVVGACDDLLHVEQRLRRARC